MKIRYQQKLNSDVSISKNTIITTPIVMDYSSFYKYNQPSTFSLLELTVEEDIGEKYVQDVTIQNDNLVLTDKLDALGSLYYYQYQTKFDCLYPNNVSVVDEEGKNIDFILEYGYLKKGGSNVERLMSFDKLILNESFDGYILNANIDGEILYNNIDVYANFPYQVFGACMYTGIIYNMGNIFSELNQGTFSLYFLIPTSSVDFDDSYIWKSGTDYIKCKKESDTYYIDYDIGGSTGSQATDDAIWHRFDYEFDNIANTSNLKVYELPPGAPAIILNVSFGAYSAFKNITNDDRVYIIADKHVIADFGLFNDTFTSLGIGSDDPLYVNRYSKSLDWSTDAYGSNPHRIRILLKTNVPAIIIYDAYDENGKLLQNRKEEVNHRLIYKKRVNDVFNDWILSETKIVLRGYLDSLLDVGDTLYVQPMIEENLVVYYNEVDKRVHVHNGEFRSNYYDDGINEDAISGNKDYYYTPEYEKIPFASDNQTTFKPYYIKVIRERANLLSPYRIKIDQFFVYEGSYPNYVIPQAYEYYRYYKDGVLYTITYCKSCGASINVVTTSVCPICGDTDIGRLDYKSARGINVFKNGKLLHNSEIINYNMYEGYIDFRHKLNADDKIEVTHLKRMSDFILAFPSLDSVLESEKNFRIYLRPHFPNYTFIHSEDFQTERLCYREIQEGKPVGSFKSCLTGLEISEYIIQGFIEQPADTDDYYYDADSTKFSLYNRILRLSDIALITDRSYSDTRIRGGGVQEVNKKEFQKWPAFLDIGYGVDGKVLYRNILFIKIPSTVLETTKNKYFFGIEEDAVIYIKRSVEQYLGSGIFYILVDENNKLWEDPYPLTVVIKK